jgi:hypothetical protein
MLNKRFDVLFESTEILNFLRLLKTRQQYFRMFNATGLSILIVWKGYTNYSSLTEFSLFSKYYSIYFMRIGFSNSSHMRSQLRISWILLNFKHFRKPSTSFFLINGVSRQILVDIWDRENSSCMNMTDVGLNLPIDLNLILSVSSIKLW